MPLYASAQEAWLDSLSALLECGDEVPGVTQPTSVGSDFGQKDRGSRELLARSFAITNPRQRLILSTQRPVDLGYALGNVLWVMSGADSLEPILFYNPNGSRFSDDGVSLFGATGARIFRSLAGDQFEQAVRRLQGDPSSRRAVVQVFLPADLFAESRDCSCVNHLQFFVRGGELSCVAYMRSQSVLMVMPYDLVLLTMLQEAMAVRLGIPLGRYVHCCGSFHYYLDEEALVRRVLDEQAPAPPAMPAMSSASPETRRSLAESERTLRLSLGRNPAVPVDFSATRLDPYWLGVLAAVAAGYRQRRGIRPAAAQLEDLPDVYTGLFQQR
jgi:thymidylate synthase